LPKNRVILDKNSDGDAEKGRKSLQRSGFSTFGRFENREKQRAKVAGKQGPILISQGPIANLDMALW